MFQERLQTVVLASVIHGVLNGLTNLLGCTDYLFPAAYFVERAFSPDNLRGCRIFGAWQVGR